jgi:hypothetical protein
MWCCASSHVRCSSAPGVEAVGEDDDRVGASRVGEGDAREVASAIPFPTPSTGRTIATSAARVERCENRSK